MTEEHSMDDVDNSIDDDQNNEYYNIDAVEDMYDSIVNLDTTKEKIMENNIDRVNTVQSSNTISDSIQDNIKENSITHSNELEDENNNSHINNGAVSSAVENYSIICKIGNPVNNPYEDGYNSTDESIADDDKSKEQKPYNSDYNLQRSIYRMYKHFAYIRNNSGAANRLRAEFPDHLDYSKGRPPSVFFYCKQHNNIFESKPAVGDGNCLIYSLLFSIKPDLYEQYSRDKDGRPVNNNDALHEANVLAVKLREELAEILQNDLSGNKEIAGYTDSPDKLLTQLLTNKEWLDEPVIKLFEIYCKVKLNLKKRIVVMKLNRSDISIGIINSTHPYNSDEFNNPDNIYLLYETTNICTNPHELDPKRKSHSYHSGHYTPLIRRDDLHSIANILNNDNNTCYNSLLIPYNNSPPNNYNILFVPEIAIKAHPNKLLCDKYIATGDIIKLTNINNPMVVIATAFSFKADSNLINPIIYYTQRHSNSADKYRIQQINLEQVNDILATTLKQRDFESLLPVLYNINQENNNKLNDNFKNNTIWEIVCNDIIERADTEVMNTYEPKSSNDDTAGAVNNNSLKTIELVIGMAYWNQEYVDGFKNTKDTDPAPVRDRIRLIELERVRGNNVAIISVNDALEEICEINRHISISYGERAVNTIVNKLKNQFFDHKIKAIYFDWIRFPAAYEAEVYPLAFNMLMPMVKAGVINSDTELFLRQTKTVHDLVQRHIPNANIDHINNENNPLWLATENIKYKLKTYTNTDDLKFIKISSLGNNDNLSFAETMEEDSDVVIEGVGKSAEPILVFTEQEIHVLLQKIGLELFPTYSLNAAATSDCWFGSVLQTVEKSKYDAERKELLTWLKSKSNKTKTGLTEADIKIIQDQLHNNKMVDDRITSIYALKNDTVIFVAEINGPVREYTGETLVDFKSQQEIINKWNELNKQENNKPKFIVFNRSGEHYIGTRIIEENNNNNSISTDEEGELFSSSSISSITAGGSDINTDDNNNIDYSLDMEILSQELLDDHHIIDDRSNRNMNTEPNKSLSDKSITPRVTRQKKPNKPSKPESYDSIKNLEEICTNLIKCWKKLLLSYSKAQLKIEFPTALFLALPLISQFSVSDNIRNGIESVINELLEKSLMNIKAIQQANPRNLALFVFCMQYLKQHNYNNSTVFNNNIDRATELCEEAKAKVKASPLFGLFGIKSLEDYMDDENLANFNTAQEMQSVIDLLVYSYIYSIVFNSKELACSDKTWNYYEMLSFARKLFSWYIVTNGYNSSSEIKTEAEQKIYKKVCYLVTHIIYTESDYGTKLLNSNAIKLYEIELNWMINNLDIAIELQLWEVVAEFVYAMDIISNFNDKQSNSITHSINKGRYYLYSNMKLNSKTNTVEWNNFNNEIRQDLDHLIIVSIHAMNNNYKAEDIKIITDNDVSLYYKLPQLYEINLSSSIKNNNKYSIMKHILESNGCIIIRQFLNKKLINTALDSISKQMESIGFLNKSNELKHNGYKGYTVSIEDGNIVDKLNNEPGTQEQWKNYFTEKAHPALATIYRAKEISDLFKAIHKNKKISIANSTIYLRIKGKNSNTKPHADYGHLL